MRDRGYTLTEMMVVVAITALMLALAAPGLQRQRAHAALRIVTTQTLSALHLARRLALARGQSITVCGTVDDVRCVSGGTRWLLFANGAQGTDARRDIGDVILRRWSVPQDVLISGTRGYATFLPRPGAAATVTFEFRHPALPGTVRSVIVSQTGRPRVAVP